MVYVKIYTREELKKANDIWHKKYPTLLLWSEKVFNGINLPITIGLVIPGESKYYENIFYTGYQEQKNILSFDDFNKKYGYQLSKYVKQLKFENILEEKYDVIKNGFKIEVTYDNYKGSFTFLLDDKKGIINFDKINSTTGYFGEHFFEMYENDYNGLLGIFIEARKKANGKKIGYGNHDWIEKIRDLIDGANIRKIETISSSRYVRQLKFESFKEFIKE